MTVLAIGLQGPEVEAWQSTLSMLGYDLQPDGDFGMKTQKATIQFQIDRGLKPDGIVGDATRKAAETPGKIAKKEGLFDPGLRFIQAKHFTRPSRPRTVSLIIQHVMENRQTSNTAEAVGAWFSSSDSRDASSHCGCDRDSVVQYVMPNDIAWGAPGANWCGYHVENAGYSAQTASDWATPDNGMMLQLNAEHVAKACEYFGIPKVRLTLDEVAMCVRDALIVQGKKGGQPSSHPGGICGHFDVTRVWQDWRRFDLPNPKLSGWWPDHTDPGSSFPWDHYMELLRAVR